MAILALATSELKSLQFLNFSKFKSALPLDDIDHCEALGRSQGSAQPTARESDILCSDCSDSGVKQQDSNFKPKLSCHSCQYLKSNQLSVILLGIIAKHEGLKVKKNIQPSKLSLNSYYKPYAECERINQEIELWQWL